MSPEVKSEDLTDAELASLTRLGIPAKVRRDAIIAMNVNGVHSKRRAQNARSRCAQWSARPPAHRRRHQRAQARGRAVMPRIPVLLSVECPYCKAKPGESCHVDRRNVSIAVLGVHKPRARRAQRAKRGGGS